MSNLHLAPAKQRTRAHVIASQSVNHFERFVIDEGHTAQRFIEDYGYDLHVITYDERGYVEPGSLYVQLKAAETLVANGDHFEFDMDVRDYRQFRAEPMLVVLVLFNASKRAAYWIDVQQFFRDNPRRVPKRGAKTIRVHVPVRQKVSCRAIRTIRAIKQARLLGSQTFR